jgi:hypothetical protein
MEDKFIPYKRKEIDNIIPFIEENDNFIDVFGGSCNDVDHIFDFMDNCKCKVILNVNFNKYYKKKVKEYINSNIKLKKTYNGNYHASSGKNFNHCLITNF